MTGGTEAAPASRVSGMVDGTVSASIDADGRITLHVRIGVPGAAPDRGDRIELVVRPEDAQSLTGLLAAGSKRPRPRVVVPCLVGVRLGLYAR